MVRDFQSLKTRQRAERDNHHENLALRIHRSLSWLGRAEKCEDSDARFLFLWIAFNAAYAQEIASTERPAEHLAFQQFLEKLERLDAGGLLSDLVWYEFPGSIRLLLKNPFVYQPFWDYQSNRLEKEIWEDRFARDNKAAIDAIGKQNTVNVLRIVLYRLYTLRNQLVHGGATWNSSVNREQISDGENFMMNLVPVVIEIMLDHPDTLWGDACYPVVDNL